MSLDPALTADVRAAAVKSDDEKIIEPAAPLDLVNVKQVSSVQTSSKMPRYQVLEKKAKSDEIAPDQSEIRWLSKLSGSGMCHCTLSAGRTSVAVKHKKVEELWYVIKGRGEIWLLDNESNDHGITKEMNPGVSIAIPPNVSFQFRNVDTVEPLEIIISTTPLWSGKEEALIVSGNPKWAEPISNSESAAWLKARQAPDYSYAQLMNKPGSTFYASTASSLQSERAHDDANEFLEFDSEASAAAF